jgi:hypothetical protein
MFSNVISPSITGASDVVRDPNRTSTYYVAAPKAVLFTQELGLKLAILFGLPLSGFAMRLRLFLQLRLVVRANRVNLTLVVNVKRNDFPFFCDRRHFASP